MLMDERGFIGQDLRCFAVSSMLFKKIKTIRFIMKYNVDIGSWGSLSGCYAYGWYLQIP